MLEAERRCDMSEYDRLINCGFTPQMARDICLIFDGDRDGLSCYIRRMELLADV